jgi:hypothetical protein
MTAVFFTGWLNRNMTHWSKIIYDAKQNDMALIVFKIPVTRTPEIISLLEETLQNHFFQQNKISKNEKEDK